MGGKFLADIARRHTENEAPVREIVEHRHILSQFQGRIKWHQKNAGTDAHTLGHGGSTGHCDQRRGAEAVLLNMVRRLKR